MVGADAIRAGLAAAGRDEAPAEHWPAALRWRAEWDKVGYETFSPIAGDLLEALVAYTRMRGCIGEAWLFPVNEDTEKPPTKLMASYYLMRAEKLAKLPKQARGGWHAFRRAWAHRRKGLPVQDVAASGGWHDTRTLQSVYQQADPANMLRVVEGGA